MLWFHADCLLTHLLSDTPHLSALHLSALHLLLDPAAKTFFRVPVMVEHELARGLDVLS
jgi:hypothetical protein